MSFPKKSGSPRMAYSGLTNMMRRLFAAYNEADETGVPVDEVLDMQRERAELRRQQMQSVISRRAFIKGAAAAGMAAAAGKTLQTVGRAAASSHDPNVVIIGAGLAGLRCAHKLAKHGVASTVYEASPYIGGRVYSDNRSFQDLDGLPVVVERGGSFISTEHNQVRNLANSLGLTLEDINGGALFEGEEIYTIDGEPYTYDEALIDWQMYWNAFKDDLQLAPWLDWGDQMSPRAMQLDGMSVPEWFDSNPMLPKSDSRFAKLCYTDCIVEYGGDAEVQPALNLLYLLAWNPINKLTPLAGTDERWHVVGGNQQIADGLIADMSLNVETNRALAAITGDPDGPYRCHLTGGGPPVVADKLVLTLPFSILRDIHIDNRIWNNFSDANKAAITDMPMGTNAKIHLELDNRTWGPNVPDPAGTYNGVTYSDPDGYQLFWDDSVPVPIGQGPVQLVNYLGGTKGASLKNHNDPMGIPDPSDLSEALASAESIFPGTWDPDRPANENQFTGNARQSNWAASRWHKGAYAFWGIGGYEAYAGRVGTPEGNIHFAGEHTSEEYQGYMEGAVETGRRAANEVRMSI